MTPPGAGRHRVDWPDFLSRHDPVWQFLPQKWGEGAFLGNGLLGAMIYSGGIDQHRNKSNTLRWEIGRVDVTAQGDQSGYLEPRVLIGDFLLEPRSTLATEESTLRLDLWNAELRGTLLETIQSLQIQRNELKHQRRATPRKVDIADLPEDQRPRQLLPLAKTLTDTIKMIAYRAETALVGLLRPHLANEAEARALIRELFVSSIDLAPDDVEGTLTIRVHRMASPVHDRAINLLLTDLTEANFHHPETNHRFIYQLV